LRGGGGTPAQGQGYGGAKAGGSGPWEKRRRHSRRSAQRRRILTTDGETGNAGWGERRRCLGERRGTTIQASPHRQLTEQHGPKWATTHSRGPTERCPSLWPPASLFVYNKNV